jgi:hypothetical protein
LDVSASVNKGACADFFSQDAHVYGVFCLAYGIGTTSKILQPIASHILIGLCSVVGPVIGGQVWSLSLVLSLKLISMQLYEKLRLGWTVLCLLGAALMALCAILAFGFMGDVPIIVQLRQRIRKNRDMPQDYPSEPS